MQTSVPIRLVVLDERPIIRAGVAACLGLEQDLQLAGDSDSVEACLAQCVLLAPDVVLLGSVRHPPVEVVIVDVLRVSAGVRIVVLSEGGGDARARSAIEAGADGFIVQGCTARELAQAVRSVFAGRRYLDDVTALEMTRSDRHDQLQAKEVEVLRRVAAGKGNRQIAVELSTTEGTVKNHIKRILAKLNAHDRTHAVVIAAERGIIRVTH